MKYNIVLLRNIFNPKYFVPAIIGLFSYSRNKYKQNNYENKRSIRCYLHLKYCFMGISIWNYLKKNEEKIIIFSIVQDNDRAILLQKEFGFTSKIIIVPNSYIGFSCDSSLFAYNKFNIPVTKKIILFTGGFEKGFDLNLFKMLDNLSDEYILFLNIYSRDGYIEKIMPILYNLIKKNKLYINTKILNEYEYDLLVKSSFIGIPWYPEFSKKNLNFYYLGLSSGKLTKFLSAGKPVIAPSYFYNYYNLIEKKGLGYVCDKADLIPEYIFKIASNYNDIVNQIRSTYTNEIDFELNFKFVLDELNI